MSFAIVKRRDIGVLSTGDTICEDRHGECEVVAIPDVYSLIVRRKSDGVYLNISGLYFGPDARLVNTPREPRPC